jgi:hypothetical protein
MDLSAFVYFHFSPYTCFSFQKRRFVISIIVLVVFPYKNTCSVVCSFLTGSSYPQWLYWYSSSDASFSILLSFFFWLKILFYVQDNISFFFSEKKTTPKSSSQFWLNTNGDSNHFLENDFQRLKILVTNKSLINNGLRVITITYCLEIKKENKIFIVFQISWI